MTTTNLTPLVAAFFEALDDDELSYIYLTGGRLWLDSGSGELAITFGPPDDIAGHDVSDAMPTGQWVYARLEPSLADEHPRSPTGDIDFDWAGMADWERRWLRNCLNQTVRSLEDAVERSRDAVEKTRALLASLGRRGQAHF